MDEDWNWFLFGHVTGILFCLYLKLLVDSVFKSSVSCIVLDAEFADINVTNKLGVLIDENVQGYSFCPPRKYKSPKQTDWCTKNLNRIVWSKGRLNYLERPNNLYGDVKSGHFAKRTENGTVLGSLMGKKVENMDDHVSPKVQDLVDKEMWICSSYPFWHETTHHCPERKANLFGN